MNEFGCYRHVLFEDLKNYLNRNEYLAGFTSIEQAYIRANIGAVGRNEIELALSSIFFNIHELSYEDFSELLNQKKLIAGNIYIINDFLTIYLTNHLTNNEKFITYGLNIKPSLIYKILCFAINNDSIMPLIYILLNNNVKPWIALYNPELRILDDGIKDKGRIFYLQDENGNVANYDFKNILFDYNDEDYFTFDSNHLDNSSHCYNNDLRLSYGNIIQVPINRLICSYNGIFINDFMEQDLSTKLIIKKDDNYFIDYLDTETLTHLFYAIGKNKNFIA